MHVYWTRLLPGLREIRRDVKLVSQVSLWKEGYLLVGPFRDTNTCICKKKTDVIYILGYFYELSIIITTGCAVYPLICLLSTSQPRRKITYRLWPAKDHPRVFDAFLCETRHVAPIMRYNTKKNLQFCSFGPFIYMPNFLMVPTTPPPRPSPGLLWYLYSYSLDIFSVKGWNTLNPNILSLLLHTWPAPTYRYICSNQNLYTDMSYWESKRPKEHAPLYTRHSIP